jgi:hypothetical protein
MLDNEPVTSEPSQEDYSFNTHRFMLHPFSSDSH